MNFILGAYYIITPVVRPDYKDKHLIPETILSASDCICDFHPEINALWGRSKEAKQKYIQRINISQSTYEEIENWVGDNFEGGIFAYPQVFTTKELAKEFLYKFLCHLSDAKIIGIGLPEKYVDEFIKYEEPLNIAENQYGIEKLLLTRLPIEEKESKFIGYEILGYENGGFHSYLCNGLEKDFNEHFKFTLNQNGFIPSLEEAARYCGYSNEEDVGTEPVLWLPWAIYEYIK
ncbi:MULTISPECIES: hypothetical protein [unclassified Sutcliffiella]|uniref:hypothetical protein n=1 Tax=unclassified Sutcliffiella TaxID=2837532 RepID=UPI0030CF0674